MHNYVFDYYLLFSFIFRCCNFNFKTFIYFIMCFSNNINSLCTTCAYHHKSLRIWLPLMYSDVYFLVGFCDDMLIHINEYWIHCDCHETNWSISLKCNLIYMEFNFATSDEKKICWCLHVSTYWTHTKIRWQN
jgi:hypothetical protein